MPRLSKDGLALSPGQLPTQQGPCRERVARETGFGMYFDFIPQTNAIVLVACLFNLPGSCLVSSLMIFFLPSFVKFLEKT